MLKNLAHSVVTRSNMVCGCKNKQMEPAHGKTYNDLCDQEDSDQPAHPHRLIRVSLVAHAFYSL